MRQRDALPRSDQADTPRTGTRPTLAQEIEMRWQDWWDAHHTFETPNPAGPLADPDAGRRARREAVRARHVPVPVGRRAARRPPAGLHRHRRVRPLQADDRPQRAAHDGLRRVRPARRAVRRRDRAAPARSRPSSNVATYRRQLRRLGLATTRAAACRPPTPSTTAGRSGSSTRSSTPGTTPTPDKARPIDELIAEFESGGRATRPTAGRGPT